MPSGNRDPEAGFFDPWFVYPLHGNGISGMDGVPERDERGFTWKIGWNQNIS
jgi:hypothetical protein